jgi:hypothetical protein
VDALKSAFADSEKLQGLRFALMTFRVSLGRDPEAKPSDVGPPLVDAAVCDELEEALRIRFRDAAADRNLIADSGLIENLLLWVDLGEETAVRAWTDGVLDDDTGIVCLAKAATQITQSHAAGDRVTRNRPTVHRAGLESAIFP